MGMGSRTAARLAWSLWALELVLWLALYPWLVISLGDAPEGASSAGEDLEDLLWWVLLIPAAIPAYATVGALVASRRPRNAVGWLCLALGLLAALEIHGWWAGLALAAAGVRPPPWSRPRCSRRARASSSSPRSPWRSCSSSSRPGGSPRSGGAAPPHPGGDRPALLPLEVRRGAHAAGVRRAAAGRGGAGGAERRPAGGGGGDGAV